MAMLEILNDLVASEERTFRQLQQNVINTSKLIDDCQALGIVTKRTDADAICPRSGT